jgi:hypothetical protein
MWGTGNWGTMLWSGSTAAHVPAVAAWAILLLGVILGAVGLPLLRKTHPRTVGAVTLMLVFALPIAAYAGLPYTFTNGSVADATQVNANFAAATIASVGSRQISGGPTQICGTAPPSTGSMGGYAGAKAACVTACGGSTTAHMCSSDEIVRTASIAGLVTSGWFATGTSNDCSGWTSTSGNGTTLNNPWTPTLTACSTSTSVICCN